MLKLVCIRLTHTFQKIYRGHVYISDFSLFQCCYVSSLLFIRKIIKLTFCLCISICLLLTLSKIFFAG